MLLVTGYVPVEVERLDLGKFIVAGHHELGAMGHLIGIDAGRWGGVHKADENVIRRRAVRISTSACTQLARHRDRYGQNRKRVDAGGHTPLGSDVDSVAIAGRHFIGPLLVQDMCAAADII